MAIVARRPDDTPRLSTSKRAARPALQVVNRRRRWPAVVGGFALLFVMAAMLGAAVFHTQLAERQLTIDRLERKVDGAREEFDELRRDRAVLRSPQRIAEEALELGMVPGETSSFVEIDPEELAIQLAAAGVADDETTRVIDEDDPLGQFRDVKAASAEQP